MQLQYTVVDLILLPLVKIINNMLLAGEFPNILKTTKVVHIHEKSARDKLQNYRQIALISTLWKVCDKILSAGITNCLSKSEYLDDYQI